MRKHLILISLSIVLCLAGCGAGGAKTNPNDPADKLNSQNPGGPVASVWSLPGQGATTAFRSFSFTPEFSALLERNSTPLELENGNFVNIRIDEVQLGTKYGLGSFSGTITKPIMFQGGILIPAGAKGFGLVDTHDSKTTLKLDFITTSGDVGTYSVIADKSGSLDSGSDRVWFMQGPSIQTELSAEEFPLLLEEDGLLKSNKKVVLRATPGTANPKTEYKKGESTETDKGKPKETLSPKAPEPQ